MPLLFVLVLLSRGLVFGLAWAATPVTAQSYVTTGEAERVPGMSMIGAAQGLGLAVGPALGGPLSFSGLLTPMYVAPAILAAPTLLATREEQGAVAGLVGAISALTFVLGPLLGNGLYGITPVIPYLLSTIVVAGLSVFAFVHPGVRTKTW